MNYKLKTRTHAALCEALRRFECFAVRRDGAKWTLQDLQKAWTGLGTEAQYRQAVQDGFMKLAPRTSQPAPRCNGWWVLTEKGAELVLQWHNQGYRCGAQEHTEWDLFVTPPAVSGRAIAGLHYFP